MIAHLLNDIRFEYCRMRRNNPIVSGVLIAGLTCELTAIAITFFQG